MKLADRMETPACGCDDADPAKPLLPVAEALRAALSVAPAPQVSEVLPLAAARDRVLARPVRAQADMPRFDNSGMDGYALCVADVGADGTPDLPVLGISAAGAAPQDLRPGTAMRIFTGAAVPRGADTVIMQEHVRREGERVHLLSPPRAGDNIRRRGEDIRRSERVFDAGSLLDARGIAACAGAGAGQVTVWKKLRVGLVLTGDELCPAGEPLSDGAIWDVNAPMLGALIDCGWAGVGAVRHVPDIAGDLAGALKEMAAQSDLVVTSGGVSVGDRDHMRAVMETLGARRAAADVAIKPGKPVTVSALNDVPIVSLPGNPLSAYVTWLVFGAPVARRMAGLAGGATSRRHVRSETRLRHKPGRCEYRPARITGYDGDGLETVSAGGQTRSGRLGPLAEADGLVIIPAETDILEAGDLAEFLPFPG